MFLADIFDTLVHGELSHLAIGGTEGGGIAIADYPKLITAINLGLVELYSRFPLKEREIIIQLYEQITMYRLHSDYAISNTISLEDPKYIIDTVLEPFTDNILLITSVWDEEGIELPLNDLNEDRSVYTPSPDILQVPFPEDVNTLSVLYRAYPVKIPLAGVDPVTTLIDLPYQFLNALVSFVAYRVLSSIKLDEAAVYLSKFEFACNKIKELGMINLDTNINTKFEGNQWP